MQNSYEAMLFTESARFAMGSYGFEWNQTDLNRIDNILI